MHHNNFSLPLLAAACLLFCSLSILTGQRPAAGEAPDRADQAAFRLVNSAQEMIEANDTERALRTLDSVLERFPESTQRFHAHLVLGRYYVDSAKYPEAISHLRNVLVLENNETKSADELEWLREAMYLSGRAYFETRQFQSAFPVLRRLTRDHADSSWSNQAHYYIGMSHFAQGNWQKAIDSLGLVGTFADPDSPEATSVEIGRRMYIKIRDQDLPVAARLGKKVTLSIRGKSGDSEKIEAVPLPGASEVFIASIATKPGVPIPNNSIVELMSGDDVEVVYVDENTASGEPNITRLSQVRAVSSGMVMFTTATLDSPAVAAFVNQPLNVVLDDADLSVSSESDTATVEIFSRYALPPGEDLTLEEIAAQPVIYETRDKISLALREVGEPPVRTGRFAGRFFVLEDANPAQPPEGMPALRVGPEDEVVVVYMDGRHGGGEKPREILSAISVSGSLEGRPRATQFLVAEATLKARKNLVEATAYLELARIFESMGLGEGAAERAKQGIALVNEIIQDPQEIPAKLREEAFQRKWELELAKKDYSGAIATCTTFSRLFPESPVVDQALIGIGMVKMEEKQYSEARGIFERILAIPNSQVRGQAQFLIAQTVELENPTRKDAAIPFYRQTAERFPNSEYAGEALSKLVDYYIETRDFSQAEDLLGQIFEDHPDAPFLDAMLLKWAILAFRREDFPTAKDKCTQLLLDYPESRFAPRAQELLPRIEAKLES